MAQRTSRNSRLRKETLRWIAEDAALFSRQMRSRAPDVASPEAAELLEERRRLRHELWEASGAPVDVEMRLAENLRRLRMLAASGGTGTKA